MGIYIGLHVAQDVSQEEWGPVYEESLRLAKEFHLMDSEEANICGETVYCGIPVEEYETDGKKYWRTLGDYDSMRQAEYQRMPRILPALSPEQKKVTFHDPLLSIAPGRSMLKWEDARCDCSHTFWGNKTQGEPYHMYLLAIGCVIEHRLGGKACVDGDITLGQCRKAIELANQYLKNPIGMPVRCKAKSLYRRVRSFPLKKEEYLDVFQGLYLGIMDDKMGTFIRENFSEEERAIYWQRRFDSYKVGTFGFSAVLKEYFNLGNDLEKLCELIKNIGKDEPEYYRAFVHEIMNTNLFWKKKDLRDCLEIEREAETPYTIHTLMAQFLFSGGRNHSVDAYIPLEKVWEILDRQLTGLCDVHRLIHEYIEQYEKQQEEKPSEILNNFIDSRKELLDLKRDSYDICELEDLCYFEHGDTIYPDVKKACMAYLEFYRGVCEEERFTMLMEESADERRAFLVLQNSSIFLMKSRWIEIFDEIEKNAESFRRYYPMVRVQPSRGSAWVVYAYVTNEDFYHYCETLPNH